MERQAEWHKYAYTFLITAVIFATAIFLSNFFNQKKINEIQNIESRISVDLLSSETQFSLLSEIPCSEIGNSFLSKEMSELGDKLATTEESRGSDNAEVLNLKRYYSLLQIKDFLLSQKVKDRCGTNSPTGGLSIIYFYSNQGDCPDCEKEGYVLTKLRQDYPDLRVYSFDYNLDLSALRTLISIYNIQYNPPTLFIGKDIYYGFRSVDDVKKAIPQLAEIDKAKAALEKANSTSTKTK